MEFNITLEFVIKSPCWARWEKAALIQSFNFHNLTTHFFCQKLFLHKAVRWIWARTWLHGIIFTVQTCKFSLCCSKSTDISTPTFGWKTFGFISNIILWPWILISTKQHIFPLRYKVCSICSSLRESLLVLLIRSWPYIGILILNENFIFNSSICTAKKLKKFLFCFLSKFTLFVYVLMGARLYFTLLISFSHYVFFLLLSIICSLCFCCEFLNNFLMSL